MRVIAGEAKRLRLVAPKGMDTRPTSDKIKETLFNILAPDLYDAAFLDLFAGSGGIGIEALSRGASKCAFIEKDKEAVKCIRTNLETTRLTDRADVYPVDVLSFLHNLKSNQKYDIVFMDPPYKVGLEKSVLAILAGCDITTDDAMIICESAIDTDYSFADELGFDITRIKEYKNNKHVFLRKR